MYAVELADGELITGERMGKMKLDDVNKIVLDNVVYAPGFNQTLISVKQLIDQGMKVEFTDKECFIYDKPVYAGKCLESDQGTGKIQRRENRGPSHTPRTCETCAKSKITHSPAPRVATRPPEAQDEVCHGDLAGPFRRSYNGNSYYFALKWMGHTSVYFLRNKSDAARSFKAFMKVINRRFGDTKSLKIYRSDNGGEFLGAEFRKVCEDEGISTEMSEPHAHHQNGVAERTHRTLADSARALMLQADMPHYLWEYAIRSAVHTRNRFLAKGDKTKTPFEKFWGRKPDMKHVKTFGQRCVVYIPSEERSTKFQFRPKGRAGIFLGSDPERKGYLYTSRVEGIVLSTARAWFFWNHQTLIRLEETIQMTDWLLWTKPRSPAATMTAMVITKNA
ncbi:Integrase core domain [Phytophthora infestans]|uniref:Integrase core domain n=1 Tax=Phytophthora infestans TaxID=4787 RepID=A0A8S9UVM7_PHYIN|nr:Integrase core domain [Phytophthora infestans]